MSLKESSITESYLSDLVDPIAPIGSLIDWTQFANCKGKTKLFFAPKAERPQARERREAKAKSLCAGCTVKVGITPYRSCICMSLPNCLHGNCNRQHY